MPKKSILQDIKPMTKTDAPVAKPVKRTVKQAPILPREIPFEPTVTKESPKYTLWYVAGVCLVAFLLSLSFLFESATVKVTAKTLALDFDSSDQFVASKDTNDEDAISFTIMTLSGTETMKLPGTASKKLNEYATGTVMLYNNYRSTSYPLVKGTRLVTPDGKEYKLTSAVSIPGYKNTASGIVPGSIEAKVIASVAGDIGNIEKADFTLPGLKNTAQETKIFGRTKSAITGGVTGDVYSISQSSADSAVGELTVKLKNSLTSKAKVQVPEGYLFYDGATTFKLDGGAQALYSKEKDVPIVLKGTMSAYLIKKDTLLKSIVMTEVSQYGGEEVTIPALSNLKLVPKDANSISPLTDTVFKFGLIGHADIIWTVPVSEIKNSLVSAKKVQFEGLAGGIKAIDKATVVIKPFWKRTFPKNPDRIKVVIENPAE